MVSEIPAAIHHTMHPSGVWTVDGTTETYRGPCDTRVVRTGGVPGPADLTHHDFHTVSFTRSVAPVPSSSEEEDPEEGSTPPSSPQIMPQTEDIPESSHRGESSEQILPLAVMPIRAVAPAPVFSPEPEQPHYLTDESEELEVDEEAPEQIEVHSPEHVHIEEEEDEAAPDYPEYIPGADDSDEEDEDQDDLGFDEPPDFVDFEDEALWQLDDEGDFPLDSDDEMVSCITSEDSSSSSEFGPGW